jgi:hypothetical protein
MNKVGLLKIKDPGQILQNMAYKEGIYSPTYNRRSNQLNLLSASEKSKQYISESILHYDLQNSGNKTDETPKFDFTFIKRKENFLFLVDQNQMYMQKLR